MKVALCTEWFYPKIGGVASHVGGLAMELGRMGHEVIIITKKSGDAPSPNHPQIAKALKLRYLDSIAPFSTILTPPDPVELLGLLKREGFDILHSHHAFTPTPLLSIVTAKKLGIPTVLTTHTIPFANDVRPLWTPISHVLFLFGRCIGEADKVIAVSRAAADFIRHFVKQEKCVIIPNGVDTCRFHPSNCGTSVGGTVATKEVGPIILYVGRLVHRKGVHILVKAMPFMLKEFPRARLLIAGDGYMRKPLSLLIKRLNLEVYIKLLGFIPEENLPKLFKASDLFVLPSLYGESFGLVLLEAMASGKPIVASKVGGIPEVIEDGVTGLLVKSGSKRDLADAITRILSDRGLAETLANNARRTAEERYSWPIIAKGVEGVYKELLEGSKRLL